MVSNYFDNRVEVGQILLPVVIEPGMLTSVYRKTLVFLSVRHLRVRHKPAALAVAPMKSPIMLSA